MHVSTFLVLILSSRCFTPPLRLGTPLITSRIITFTFSSNSSGCESARKTRSSATLPPGCIFPKVGDTDSKPSMHNTHEDSSTTNSNTATSL